ncbi:rhodanese-like domain-containing protein [Jeotgalibacillus sp. R-1-5s-1]|uniref:rhodanese-like domain-containing protein n=1 Tax=Jeotgalibacillus sp. R-1-5s-1 TaxID=2555897 RepID=UPI00106BAFD8|nr:rhodanese-like domain-containing protein [Jeotgalibacillus sp. R-1-5s-1]TFD98167.1 rhodanese-like domain-containing protein [Jeotgalibacillus sp. R-1-5s-1]
MSELKTLTAKEVQEKLEAGESLHLIDVREDDEVAEGMIPQATHIPMGDISMHLDELDTETEYVLICRSGRRSENVGWFLHDHGYRVVNMTGGMLEYQGETKPKA